ncbi:MAG: signal recognition particle subunit SRP19/SEC65 family protein [Desulfurococcaceae archaeon]
MSRELRFNRIVVYPAYFDANLTRKEGRRVPLHLAVPSPSLEHIFSTCKTLGLNPELEPDKTYPRCINAKGRIIIDKRGSKLKTLYLVANELRRTYRRGP